MLGSLRTVSNTVTEAMKCELLKMRISSQTNGYLMFPTPQRALTQIHNMAFASSLTGSVTKVFPPHIGQQFKVEVFPLHICQYFKVEIFPRTFVNISRWRCV